MGITSNLGCILCGIPHKKARYLSCWEDGDKRKMKWLNLAKRAQHIWVDMPHRGTVHWKGIMDDILDISKEIEDIHNCIELTKIMRDFENEVDKKVRRRKRNG